MNILFILLSICSIIIDSLFILDICWRRKSHSIHVETHLTLQVLGIEIQSVLILLLHYEFSKSFLVHISHHLCEYFRVVVSHVLQELRQLINWNYNRLTIAATNRNLLYWKIDSSETIRFKIARGILVIKLVSFKLLDSLHYISHVFLISNRAIEWVQVVWLIGRLHVVMATWHLGGIWQWHCL